MLTIRNPRAHTPTHFLTRFAQTLVAATALAFSLVATPIQAADDAKSSPQTTQRGRLSITPGQLMKPWTGDLDGMIERRAIRVLVVYSKTFYFVDKGVQRGSTYEFSRLFEADLNKKLSQENRLKNKNLKVQVVFIPIPRGELLQALAAGKGDIAAASLTITEGRKKLVDFAVPIYPNVSEVVVSGPGSPAVTSVDELAGKTIYVRKSSSYYESLVALNKRFVSEKKPPVILKEAPDTLEDEDLIEMVNAGLVPLIVVDKPIADFWKQIFPEITVHNDVAVRTGGNIAWAVRKGNPQIRAAVDDFMRRNAKGSAEANVILVRYFKNAKYVKDAGSESERAKFISLLQYFRKYGDKYDVDWVLMAAQGYQESQLNQNARSRVGAIGVMQVMPATGKELGVGNIEEVEPNIQAGIKYMRWMIDQYYGKEPMTKLDKALFAFASYNAGAGRISTLRKEAAKRGLDPNVWFRNVEYVAAEKIGAETVTYVGNIYKYYIAYNLILEGKAEREKQRK